MRNNYADTDAQPELLQHSPADNTAAVCTKAADSEQFWVVAWITWSYDDTPTGGNLVVDVVGTTVLEVDITTGGPGQLEFNYPLYVGTKNEALTVTLAAPGAGKAGKLNVRIR